MTQEILPPLPENGRDPRRKGSGGAPQSGFAFDFDTLPPALQFTAVPRKRKRSNGLTPDRQRLFIAYLAANGSVEKSAKAIGASDTALYQLKRAESAESFSAAWDIAIDMGAGRVRDILMDHAIHGVPETVIKDGDVILERRKYNTRAMMWIVQQRFPEQYGGALNVSGRPASSLPHGMQKLKEEWKEEWRKEWEAEHLGRATEEETNAALLKKLKVLHTRMQETALFEFLDDPAKQAAIDVLYGAKDWEDIRRRAEAHAAEQARQVAERERNRLWREGLGK